MHGGRRGRGFERAGRLSADRLGLPQRHGRRLVLAEAWRAVAGDAIADRAPVVDLRRGVLALGLPDGTWGRTLRELLPGLAARLAASRPELGIRRYRFDDEKACALPAPGDDRSAVEPRVTSPAGDEPPAGSTEPLRIEDVMAHYLERTAGR